jgi:hypothetical protein
MTAAQAQAILGKLGVSPQLCEYQTCGGTPSAFAFAEAWSVYDWGFSSTEGTGCTGPYGDGHTAYQTQWACYGVGYPWAGAWIAWQVNVDPYGNQTYAVLH